MGYVDPNEIYHAHLTNTLTDHNKFWEVTVYREPGSVRTERRWGRIGTPGQVREEHFAFSKNAMAHATTLAKEKLGKGYILVLERQGGKVVLDTRGQQTKPAPAYEPPPVGNVAPSPGLYSLYEIATALGASLTVETKGHPVHELGSPFAKPWLAPEKKTYTATLPNGKIVYAHTMGELASILQGELHKAGSLPVHGEYALPEDFDFEPSPAKKSKSKKTVTVALPDSLKPLPKKAPKPAEPEPAPPAAAPLVQPGLRKLFVLKKEG